jgi:hypothetical protein
MGEPPACRHHARSARCAGHHPFPTSGGSARAGRAHNRCAGETSLTGCSGGQLGYEAFPALAAADGSLPLALAERHAPWGSAPHRCGMVCPRSPEAATGYRAPAAQQPPGRDPLGFPGAPRSRAPSAGRARRARVIADRRTGRGTGGLHFGIRWIPRATGAARQAHGPGIPRATPDSAASHRREAGDRGGHSRASMAAAWRSRSR